MMDADGKDISGNFEAQVRRVFALMDQTLKRAGGTLANLVTMTVFIKEPRYGSRSRFRASASSATGARTAAVRRSRPPALRKAGDEPCDKGRRGGCLAAPSRRVRPAVYVSSLIGHRQYYPRQIFQITPV